jgi:hypothetical protein
LFRTGCFIGFLIFAGMESGGGGADASGAFLRSETEEIRERANWTTDAEALRGIGDYSSGFCGVVENRAGRTELMSNEAKRI